MYSGSNKYFNEVFLSVCLEEFQSMPETEKKAGIIWFG